MKRRTSVPRLLLAPLSAFAMILLCVSPGYGHDEDSDLPGHGSLSKVANPLINCRLATRTAFADGRGEPIAALGSDTLINLESLVASKGWATLTVYVAESRTNPTVRVEGRVLVTEAESVILAKPFLSGTGLLGLLKRGLRLRILESIPGLPDQEPYAFHKVQFRGKLLDPAFTDCESGDQPGR